MLPDANTYKKGLSPVSQQHWLNVANNILAKGGDETQAIRMANIVTRAAQNRLKQQFSQSF